MTEHDPLPVQAFAAVDVRIGDGITVITTVAGARHWLLDHWPDGVTKPESYAAAIEACTDALDGVGDIDEARVALIIVAADAELLDGTTVV